MAGFGSQYQDIGGGDWLSGDEKSILIESGQPFLVTDIIEDKANKYGERLVLKILLVNPETGDEEEKNLGLALGTVESRDRQLYAMRDGVGDYPGLANGGEPVKVKLTKVGNSQILQVLDEE
jgi:hypothetical protein